MSFYDLLTVSLNPEEQWTKFPQTLTREIEDFLDNVVSRLPAARGQNVCVPFQQCYFVQLNARNPAQQRCALTGWFHELSSLQVLHLFSDIWKSLVKLWACRNPEQQIVLKFLGVCLLLVQWPSGCDLWPVRSGRVLDSGLFGWVHFLCPRLKCRRLSAAVRREVMKCLKPRRQRWSLSQLEELL